MGQMTLVIGNKNYSSWSLRPWIALRQNDIPFTEHLIPLFDENWKTEVSKVSPTEKVPVLIDGDVTVWETLAILEYVNEKFPDRGLWPADSTARALARAVSMEMHAGFSALRGNMPMNIRKDLSGKGMGPGVAEDIKRICELWNECRAKFGQGGPFLFGTFTIADAMYAPVVSRFTTFGVKLDDVCQAYCDAVLDTKAYREWKEAAVKETWTVAEDEID